MTSQQHNIHQQLKQWIDRIHGHAPDRYHWVGIYLLDKEGKYLELFPYYIGRETPHIRIPIEMGLCGAAVREGKTLNVPDVHSDHRYIACSLETRSEIVVPIRAPNGQVLGEIDIDSDLPAAFTPQDQQWLEGVASEIGRLLASVLR